MHPAASVFFQSGPQRPPCRSRSQSVEMVGFSHPATPLHILSLIILVFDSGDIGHVSSRFPLLDTFSIILTETFSCPSSHFFESHQGNACNTVCSWMGCDCCGAQEKAIGKIADNDKRSCTDVPFLLLFLGFWAAIIILMAVAIQGYGGRQPANMNAYVSSGEFICI
jgi:hypothetical protein